MKHGKCFYFLNKGTVEPRYNEPPGITNDILGPGESYSKLNGIEPRCNEPRYNEQHVITEVKLNAEQMVNSKRVTAFCQHLIYTMAHEGTEFT